MFPQEEHERQNNDMYYCRYNNDPDNEGLIDPAPELPKRNLPHTKRWGQTPMVHGEHRMDDR